MATLFHQENGFSCLVDKGRIITFLTHDRKVVAHKRFEKLCDKPVFGGMEIDAPDMDHLFPLEEGEARPRASWRLVFQGPDKRECTGPIVMVEHDVAISQYIRDRDRSSGFNPKPTPPDMPATVLPDDPAGNK